MSCLLVGSNLLLRAYLSKAGMCVHQLHPDPASFRSSKERCREPNGVPLDAIGCHWTPLDAIGCHWMRVVLIARRVFCAPCIALPFPRIKTNRQVEEHARQSIVRKYEMMCHRSVNNAEWNLPLLEASQFRASLLQGPGGLVESEVRAGLSNAPASVLLASASTSGELLGCVLLLPCCLCAFFSL